ncbi:MAG: hypothetical protein KGL95_01400, partial [Patescibacteria group bacterium]|nr:hypothetical protein [Patescibacteria group bacterium]
FLGLAVTRRDILHTVLSNLGTPEMSNIFQTTHEHDVARSMFGYIHGLEEEHGEVIREQVVSWLKRLL